MKTMMKKQKPKDKFVQLDIDAAMAGRDEFIQQEIEDEVFTTQSAKNVSLFDIVNDIRRTKNGKFLDTESGEKSFSSFMVLRALSMNSNDVALCNILNEYQGLIPKKAMYEALLGLIQKDRSFYKYINSNSETKFHCLVDKVAKYYEIPKSHAQEFIDIMGEEWAFDINDKFGGESSTT